MQVHTKQKDGSTTVREFDYISIWDIIDELRQEPKTTLKQQILKDNKDNFLWLRVLQYTYDTSKNYGIRDLDQECFQRHNKYNAEPLSDEYMFSLLDKLEKRELTGNKAKSEILNFCRNCNDGLQDLLQLILWRDLDVGASVKSFNKAYGKNFIYEFKTMAARGKKIEYPCYVETKMNGQRLVIEKEDGVITFKSRNGKSYSPPYLIAQADFLLAEHDNVMLDCEIDGIPSEYGETSLYNSDAVRTAVNGHINQFIRGTAPAELDLKFRVNVFDMLTLDEFRGKVTSVIQEDRYHRLEDLFDGIELHNFRWEEPKLVISIPKIREIYLNVVSNKGEGIIIKKKGKPYQLGDSQHWIKAKQEVEVDLEIVDFYKGNKSGKRADTVGGVMLKTSDGLLEVNCGSGLKDVDMDFIMDNQDELIGRIVRVKFNTIVDKKTSSIKSLFLPRFTGGNKTVSNFVASLRDDKDIANSLEEVILEEQLAQENLFKEK